MGVFCILQITGLFYFCYLLQGSGPEVPTGEAKERKEDSHRHKDRRAGSDGVRALWRSCTDYPGHPDPLCVSHVQHGEREQPVFVGVVHQGMSQDVVA